MAEPICEDEGLMQEWTPLTQLLQQIPLKTQRGLFSQNLNLTCLGVVPEFIALGTNLGFVYWYCRATGDLQRLRFENCHSSVTCVKIMQFADYMVAAGTDQGTVIVFQIPKIEHGSTPDQIKTKQKQIERFTINGLHQAAITSIEWDPNEMRIFSGDKNGGVVLTEINLSLHISKSMELLNEQFEIVQLSYSQNILLISTVYRSIICDGSNNWKVNQVGTKERKILGKFGATLCKYPHGLVVFASRPGHRLWLSDKNGVVQQTLIFKSAVQSNCPKIQLINPIDKKGPCDTSFGRVIQFGDNKLVTYNSEILYVLHPGAVSVVSVLNGARKILDLAVNENEIFILEGERSLLRIGALPDKYSLDMLHQPVSRRTSFNLDEFAAKIKDTAVESLKKITKDLIPNNEQTSPNSPPAVADEALELPPVVTLPAGLPSLYTEENIEIHSSVPSQNFSVGTNSLNNADVRSPSVNNFSVFNQDMHEEIITRPLRKCYKKKAKHSAKPPGSALVSESESDTTSNFSEDRLVCGVANDLSLSDESAFSESQNSFSVLKDIPSLLNRQKMTPKNEDVMKTSDTKSQTSLDTCESVSERLLLTSEAFREEQERTFARLANQSLFDSYNSEKTDNMSISLNMTTSSSVSSKISENIPSPSYTSENSGVASRTKSIESQNYEQQQIAVASLDGWNSGKEECTSESSASNRISEKELECSNEVEGESPDVNVTTETFHELLTSEQKTERISLERKGCHCEAAEPSGSSVDSKNADSVQELHNNTNGGFFKESEHFNELEHFSQSETFPADDENIFKKDKENEEKKGNPTAMPFLSDQPLCYGPPSGSSLLSSQPSSDFSSIPQFSQPLVRDSFDHWPQYKTPEKITSLAACKNYVVCTDNNDRVYYSRLSGLGLSWVQLDYKASLVRVAGDGSAVWMLNKTSVVALVEPSLTCPISDTVVEIAQDIRSFSIDFVNNDGLMVTLAGEIINYNDISKGQDKCKIKCDYIIADVVSLGGMILALSNDLTLLCKMPEEDEFKVIKTLKPTTCLALGPENLLWVVDDANNIFFSDDFLSENPQWWQIQISDYVFKNSSSPFQSICNKIKLNESKGNVQTKKFLVATNENSVWIYNKSEKSVWVNKTGFTGYIWRNVSSIKLLPSIEWQMICAKGVFEEKGCVWLLSLDGSIFCTTADYQRFQSIPVPCEENILCMTSSVDVLWVLSGNGRIHSRLGLSQSNQSGTRWIEIRSPQIDNLKFVWVSCGSDVAWACDIHGRTFMTVGSPQQMNALEPVWVEVEGRPKDVQFEKVFVGTQLYLVWAIDNNRNLYVREGIFPHYQIGTSWVYVCGIEAIHVTISGAQVWALASNGDIYRRCGVSENNIIGDYWRKIPGNLKMVSSSLTGELWGVSQESKIQKLSCNLKVLRKEKTNSENKEARSLTDDFSWEIVK